MFHNNGWPSCRTARRPQTRSQLGEVFRSFTLETECPKLIDLLSNEWPKAATLFSEARFAEAWVRGNKDSHVVELWSGGAPSAALMYAVGRYHSLGRHSISLAPFGLYAYPQHRDGLSVAVRDVIAQLKTLRTISFEWN